MKFLTAHTIALSALLMLGRAETLQAAPDSAAGQLIVRLDQAVTGLADGKSFLKDAGAPAGKLSRALVPELNIFLYTLDQPGNETQAREELAALPLVIWAQLDHIVEMRDTFPDDPSFAQQWSLNQSSDADVDAPQAWDLGVDSLTALGDPVVCAIIDSGFEPTHPDLTANIWRNTAEIPDNGIDDDENGYVDDVMGWNAYANNGELPANYHGTHVAGIVAARGNNGVGVTGINWQGTILLVAGSSTQTSIVTESYNYVMAVKNQWLQSSGAEGANVVSTNSSFGVDFADCESGEYPVWNDLYDAMGALGILSAAATMNNGSNVDQSGDVPTSCSSDFLVTVTNTTSTDQRNNGAAFGLESIDLGAPGTQIFSTFPGGSYSTRTGTSMATPHVAGAISWLHSVAPAAFCQWYLEQPEQAALYLKDVILDSVDPLVSLQGQVVSGGRLNLASAGALIQQFGNSAPLELSIQSLVGNRLELSWTAHEEALSYRVERRINGSSNWEVLNEGVELTLIVPQMLGREFYRVIAVLPDL